MKFKEWVDCEPEKGRLNFCDNPEQILNIVNIVSLPVIQQYVMI